MSGDIEIRQVVLAGLVRRAAARLIDVLCMLMLCALSWLAAGIALAILVVVGQIDPVFGTEGASLAVFLAVSMVVLAVVSVYRYEAVATARRGQTFGKQAFSIAVVSYPYRGEQGFSRRRSRTRWTVPHGAFIVAGAAGMASVAVLGAWGLVVGAGAAAAGWTAVYASALLDDDRRGWHDKRAGTAVVRVGDDGAQPLFAEPDADEPRSEPARASAPGSSPGLPKAARAVMVGLVTAAAAAAVSSCAYLLLSASGSLGIEESDDTGSRPELQGVNYRKFSNPDGDLCWREEHSFVYYCDLVSIGGLQWDTGDLGYARMRALYLGSGVLCALSEDGVRCWEWSPDVQPRPARTPDGVVFRTLEGDGGFVCGQTPDYVTVVCWTVGVGQRSYRQATHRFRDGSQWFMNGASRAIDDMPGYWMRHPGTKEGGLYDAFTGAVLFRLPNEPAPLEPETTPS